MKNLFLILGSFLISFTQVLAFESCTNLSHVYKLGAGDVHFKFLSCELVERETYLNGTPMGDKNYLNIKADWTVINIDDEYEKVTNHQRWMWNKDQTKLIHEFVVDSFNKADASFDFISGSEVFSLTEAGVEKKAMTISRRESSIGEIEQQVSEKITSYKIP